MDEKELQRRAQLAEEMLLTDERLRGGLTDDQFEEILRWALPLAHEAAAATASIEERAAADAALEERMQQLRQLVRQAVRLAEEQAEASAAPAAWTADGGDALPSSGGEMSALLTAPFPPAAGSEQPQAPTRSEDERVGEDDQ
ncbi:MAG: hypothetical protein RMM58_13035 [Chloroflexota bacterium]|nr:hypothetical protein [Dehalococcoidia bacterium]MDW8254795.1 hypothetical protein [Chloroflexota bacterium]